MPTRSPPSPSQHRPLPDLNPLPSQPHVKRETPLKNQPEFIVHSIPLDTKIDSTSNYVEYKVYNFQTLRSGRIIRNDGWNIGDLLVICLLNWTWTRYDLKNTLTSSWKWDSFHIGLLVWLGCMIGLVVSKCRTIIYESVIPLPGLGIQISTSRGFPLPSSHLFSSDHNTIHISLSTSSKFIPIEDISTVVINEGLVRWRVVSYLAIILKRGQGVVVVFQNVRPRLPVLIEVYHGIREIMWDEFQ
ncbi:hypothetical protein TREMEDRAFT_74924 [Tremella mesenterica DSM 1558]|uniref:uncharacterized protein n=1 Tax=Tremella mesenterica (strain ATCC 24925 / CBS 8224 / DSM 1558 / NBRC 9311 / NRRL Y-6157 / RJB 2259-6 / UBC 559-6) TaxID=578456 RepID=UPI00032C29FB|nr:uncharacterized protein TREMEDRAFT_74924 [Tremella mesenterica DSM 1558]EIW65799.1 hypothetical protein TREMEDRAFT_74924 [Tremella mesenterica DSM 1558]